MHGVDQVTEITAQTIKFPDDERVALPQCLETGGKPGAVIPLAGGGVLVGVPQSSEQKRTLSRADRQVVTVIRVTQRPQFA